MAVIESLAAKRDFTRAEAELADYILRNADEVARMGISEIASAAYKSNATVVRLCRKVGTSGWREFRLELATDLEKARRTEHDVNPSTPFVGKPSTASIMNSISLLEREAIKNCYSQVPPASIGEFARACLKARHIIYWGLGDTYATVYAFGGLMSKIGVQCVAADQYRFRQEAAFHSRPNDIALFVSYTGRLFGEVGNQIEHLRKNRTKIAAITSDVTALEGLGRFDYVIELPLRENRYHKVATFYAQTCIRYVLNCVYSVAFSQNYDVNIVEKDIIEELEPGLVGGHQPR